MSLEAKIGRSIRHSCRNFKVPPWMSNKSIRIQRQQQFDRENHIRIDLQAYHHNIRGVRVGTVTCALLVVLRLWQEGETQPRQQQGEMTRQT
jgi:hypothetical protein